jgi:hypothetical protein
MKYFPIKIDYIILYFVFIFYAISCDIILLYIIL